MATPATESLLERDAELAAIGRTLDEARAGEGGCVVLAGAAGLGKTRLLAAARASAEADGMLCLRARGDELEREFPFGAAVQLFGPVARRDPAGELLSGAARLAAPLFDASAGGPGDEDAGSVYHGLHWLTANLAERAPLALCIDDIQWVDALSVRFLLYLAQRLDELPVAIVAAQRLGEEGPAARLVDRLAGHPASLRLELSPLSDAAVAALVEALLGERPDAAFTTACAAVTRGNPLFLRELLAAAAKEGLAPSAAGAERVAGLGGRSVGAAVLRRLAALPDGAKRLARAVAVLGDRCSLSDAAALAGLDPDDAADVADRLADADVLVSGDRLSFVHPLMREAVDAELPAARRHRLHLRAAELLRRGEGDAERVAEHLVRAGGATTDWAVEAAFRGARQALARGAPTSAARYLRPAAEAGDREALTELAVAEVRAGEETARDRVLAAVDAAPGPERGAVGLRLGRELLTAARPRDALAAFDRALETLAPDDELALTIRADRSAAAGLGGVGDAPPAVDELARRALRGEASLTERTILSHAAITAGLTGASADDAARLGRAALSGPPLDVARTGDMVTAVLAATALLVAGHLQETEAVTTAIIEQAREHGLVLVFASASHVRGHALERRGRLEDAIVDTQSAIDAARYGWEPALPAAHAGLALSLIERGELAAAEAALEVPDGEERFGDSLTWNDVLEAQARLRLARGDAAEALPLALEAGRNLETLGMSHAGVVPWRATAARAALAMGDVEQAARLADEDLRMARAFGAPREIGATLRTAAAVAGGARGVTLLREAVEVLASSEARLEHAHALADLGAALLGEDHRVAARTPLLEALDLASDCGASALEERARAGLIAAGARPRRARTSGRDALTPREQRLVEMAASGMTNREIAEALFITKKTVESHLAHAFRKLGVSSRAELRG